MTRMPPSSASGSATLPLYLLPCLACLRCVSISSILLILWQGPPFNWSDSKLLYFWVKFAWNHCLWTVGMNCSLEELDFWLKLSKHLHSCSGEDGDCGENWFQFSALLDFCFYQGSCLLCETFEAHFSQSGWVTVGGRVTFGTFRVINLWARNLLSKSRSRKNGANV